MIKVTVNQKEIEIKKAENGLMVEDSFIQPDIVKVSGSSYHILHDHRSYNAEVVEFDAGSKSAIIKVNGNLYPVTAKDQFDVLLEQMGLSNLSANAVSDLKAPMPGLVLKIFAKENDQVKKGDNLFVLEAMKMENIIKASADATVKSIKIKPGDKVEKNQVLINFV